MHWNALWQKNKERLARLDLFALGHSITLYYLLVFFISPILSLLGVWSARSYDPSFRRAFVYAALGLGAMLVGYCMPFAKKIANRIPRLLNREWRVTRMPWIFVGTFAIGFAIKLVRIIYGGYFQSGQSPAFTHNVFYSAIGLFDWLGPLSLVIAFITYYSLKKNGDTRWRYWRLLAWGAVAVEVLYALPSCSRMAFMTPLILWLIVRWYAWRRNILLLAGTLLFIAIIIFPWGNLCRDLSGSLHTITKQETIPALGIRQAGTFVSQSLFMRTNLFYTFSQIVARPAPLLYGRTLLGFFVSLGPPRFIWRSKPVINGGGNELGRQLGIISPLDRGTNIGPTVVGDWYLNFGFVGIILGMVFMGWLWRLISAYFVEHERLAPSEIMIYSMMWISIVKGLEDWLSPVYAGLVKLFLILLVVHFALTKKHISSHS